MAKIIGNTTATPNPRPDWAQTDATKADYIKNKPTILTEKDVVELIAKNGGNSTGGTSEGNTIQESILLKDMASGDTYKLYVTNGKLTMEPEDYTNPNDSVLLSDVVSSKKYKLYVSNGNLTMEVIE